MNFKLFKNKREGIIFLVCLLLSAFFWFLDKLDSTFTTNETLELVPVELDSNAVVVNDFNKEIQVTISGSGFDLLAMKWPFSSNEIEIPVTKINKLKSRKSVNVYLLTQQQIKGILSDYWKNKLEVITVLPDSVIIEIDKIDKRKLPVLCIDSITLEQNYVASDTIVITPDSVEVTAPLSVFDTLKFIQTEVLREQNVDETIEEDLELINSFPDLITLNPDEVSVEIMVYEYVPFEVEMSTNRLGGGKYKIATDNETVKIVGLTTQNHIDEIIPENFNIAINMETSDDKFLKLKITKQPDFVKEAHIVPSEIPYTIDK